MAQHAAPSSVIVTTSQIRSDTAAKMNRGAKIFQTIRWRRKWTANTLELRVRRVRQKATGNTLLRTRGAPAGGEPTTTTPLPSKEPGSELIMSGVAEAKRTVEAKKVAVI